MRKSPAAALALIFGVTLAATPVQSAVIYTTMDGYFAQSGLGFFSGDVFALIFSYDNTAETDTFRHANGTDYAVQTYTTSLVGGTGSLYDYEAANFSYGALQIVHQYSGFQSPVSDLEWSTSAGNTNLTLITNYPGPNGYGWLNYSSPSQVGVLLTSVSASDTPPQLPTSGVPEPSTWAMMLIGLFGFGRMMRGARRKDAVGA